jgi:uncharacterized phiE125 gp8 family phage protein
MQIVRDISTIVEPTATLVTLADAKNYLRVDFNEDDALIQSLIDSAIKRLEQYAGSAFSPRTLKVVAYVDFFIEPPYAPINSITKVEYYDNSSWVELTLDGDYYILGDVYKKVYMVSYPQREYRFTYTCGFTTLPDSIYNAILKLVADLYDYRASESPNDKLNELQMTAYELVQPYKRINYFI